MAEGKKLTPKQQAFVNEYCVDKNATQAAIRAGYSQKRAGEIGYQQLQKTPIKEAIDKKLAEHARNCDLTVQDIAQNIIRISSKAEDVDELGTALKGQMDLAKLLGLIIDKNEHSGPGGGPLNIGVIKYGD